MSATWGMFGDGDVGGVSTHGCYMVWFWGWRCWRDEHPLGWVGDGDADGMSTHGCSSGWVGDGDAGGDEHPGVLHGVGLEML